MDGYSGTFGSNDLIVEDIIMNDARNDSNFTCVVVLRSDETILARSDLTILYIAGKQLLINTNDIFPCVNFYLLATLFGMML